MRDAARTGRRRGVQHYACCVSLLYVGDELHDPEAARQAGIDFAALTLGYTRFEHMLARQTAFAIAHINDVLLLTAPILPKPGHGLA